MMLLLGFSFTLGAGGSRQDYSGLQPKENGFRRKNNFDWSGGCVESFESYDVCITDYEADRNSRFLLRIVAEHKTTRESGTWTKRSRTVCVECWKKVGRGWVL